MAATRCTFCPRSATGTFQLLPSARRLAFCGNHPYWLYLGLDQEWRD